jgi:hypothetical protein
MYSRREYFVFQRRIHRIPVLEYVLLEVRGLSFDSDVSECLALQSIEELVEGLVGVLALVEEGNEL